ncbi:ribonuclease H-like domain-containing protein [Tanacetum coccineum]|uniref:Ribonuclease H-like domain-containing protein n=1 Tax=Tanacetum coccineum TaxID=301880 RepID=A0ABQ4YRF2_9ASTR
MAAPKFAETHNLVAFLSKPEESDGFEQIIDFLNANPIKYALTVNPTIYTTCIQQFWATAKAKTVNGERQIQALVDKKKVIITETSVRSDLQLDDAEGTECLPNDAIFEQLTLMGYENLTQKLTFYKAYFSSQWKFLIHTILQCLSAKTTAWNEFSSTMASAIICLATNQKFNFSKYIFDCMVKNLEGGVKFLMYPRFVQVFLNKQLGDMSKHKEVYVTPSHTKKIFSNMKKEGKGFSGRVIPLFQTMMVQASEEVGKGSAVPIDPHHTSTTTQPSTSRPQKKQSRRKQRKGTEIPQSNGPTKPIHDKVTIEEHEHTHSNDPLLSGEDRLKLTELMELCTNLQKKVLDLEEAKTAQAKEIASLKKRVKKLEKRRKSRNSRLKRLRKVGSARRVTLIDETQGRSDDNLIFDTDVLEEQEVEVKKVVTKPKAVTTVATTTTTTVTRPKASGVVVQDPKAELEEEEERLVRQKEEEANIALIESWDNTQAKMEVAFQLAQQLHAEEQEQLSIEEKSRLFVELMDKRKKHFVKLRAKEQRRKPPTKAQKRNTMSTYLKNMAGYKHNQLKTKSFEDIQMLFDKEMKRVNTFIYMNTELVEDSKTRAGESSSKRAITELEQEVAKKQRIDDDQHEAEMKNHMEIVPDDEVAIDVIPLATKPLIIVEWKIIKEGKMGYFQLIRANESSKRYSLMIQMLQNIDKEDLETLWKLVKAKHGNTRLEESSVNASPTVKRVLNKGKQIWKPKGKLSDNRLNKTKRVWKATGKLFADIGYQWRPTGKKFTLGKLDCGYQWRPTGKKFALGEMCPLTKLSVKWQFLCSDLGRLPRQKDILLFVRVINGADQLKAVRWSQKNSQIHPGQINGTGIRSTKLMSEYYEGVGIFHQKSVPRTPQQNGVVERRNRTLVEAACIMMIFSKALCFYGQEESSLCYPTNDSEDLGKFQAKADIGIFGLVGVAPSRKGYRIYNKRTRRLMETIYATFDEMHKKMAPVRLSSGPEPFIMTPGQLKSGLAPTDKELEMLFQPMFDEYLEQSRVNEPVPSASKINAQVVPPGTSLSTTIAQDAPSTSASSSTSEMHHPVQEIAKEPTHEDPLSIMMFYILHMTLLLEIHVRHSHHLGMVIIQLDPNKLITTRSSQKMDQRSSSG